MTLQLYLKNQEGAYSVLPATHTKWRYKPLRRWEQFRHFFKLYESGTYYEGKVLAKAILKPRHPIVELISRLKNPEEQMRHWKRFEALGAFA